jgi:hypothetical protein
LLYAYYVVVKDKRDNKTFLDKVGDWLRGDHADCGHEPAAPAVPSPHFAATSVPQAVVPGESFVLG